MMTEIPLLHIISTRSSSKSNNMDDNNSNKKDNKIRKQTPTKSSVNEKSNFSDHDDELLKSLAKDSEKDWNSIAEKVNASSDDKTKPKTGNQCMNRWKNVLKETVRDNEERRKGKWESKEDELLKAAVQRNGKPDGDENKTKWGEIARSVPGRVGKQCRERYLNHLSPSVEAANSPWSSDEDQLIKTKRSENISWPQIAKLMPGRSENSVKNRFHSLSKAKERENLIEVDDVASAQTPLKKRRSI